VDLPIKNNDFMLVYQRVIEAAETDSSLTGVLNEVTQLENMQAQQRSPQQAESKGFVPKCFNIGTKKSKLELQVVYQSWIAIYAI